MIGNLRKLGAYLLGKRIEVQQLDLKDLLMAKVILDIHRSSKKIVRRMNRLRRLNGLL